MEIRIIVLIIIVFGIGYSIRKYTQLKKSNSENRFAYYHTYTLIGFWSFFLVFKFTGSMPIAVITGLMLLSSIIFGVIARKSEKLELKETINKIDSTLSPIDRAICNKSSQQLVALIKGGELSNTNINDHIADAVYRKWNQGVSILLDNGANPNGQDISGETLLVGALKNEDNITAKLLIAHGASTNIPEEENEHLIIFAIHHGLMFIINECINQDVDINMQDSENEFTPLMHAIVNGNMDIVKLLLKNGANPNIGTELPYEGSYLYTSFDCAVEQNQLDILKLLVDSGKLNLQPDDVSKLIEDNSNNEPATELQKYLSSLRI